MPNYRVEVGFQSTNQLFDALVLDDATRGKLNVGKLAGGLLFYDVSSYVRSITVSRGKSRQLDRYASGQASVDFINTTRVFDPTFTSSPFYGEILPKRTLRIWADNVLAYVGIIDDWNLSYSPNGESIATANASDSFAVLANRTITPATSTVQLSGARVETILDDPLVSFPLSEREIDAGAYELGADVIPENTNALTYLQNVEVSEGGDLFVGANGYVVFKQKYAIGTMSDVLFADDGTGIPYGDLQVSYGSELLYNEINLTSAITNTTVSVSDTTSQSQYGILALDLTDLLLNDDTELESLANYLLARYKQPEYRFESVRIDLRKLTSEQIASLLELELADVVSVKFTPNNIPPAIEQFAQIVGIEHDVSLETNYIVFRLGQLPNVPLRLDSTIFGKLDQNTLG